jgi:hypothetical protein
MYFWQVNEAKFTATSILHGIIEEAVREGLELEAMLWGSIFVETLLFGIGK